MDVVASLFEWLGRNVALTTAMLVLTIGTLVGTLWIGHYYLTTIPPDYFSHRHKPLERWRDSHPVWRWTLLIAKNVLGALFIASGVIMLFTPGQGILTLLLGLALVDLPGKQKFERKLIERPAVLKAVNLLRARAKKPPLEF